MSERSYRPVLRGGSWVHEGADPSTSIVRPWGFTRDLYGSIGLRIKRRLR